MQRLADVHPAPGGPAAEDSGSAADGRRPGSRAQATAIAWFGLGVLASGALGAGAAVGLRALESGELPVNLAAWAGTPRAAKPALPAIPQEPDGAGLEQDGGGQGWATYHVAIARGPAALTRLPLQLMGGDDATAFEVLLGGFPAGVRPTRGEQRGESTWLVKHRDLEDLHLAIDAGAPQSFEVRIAVLAPVEVATAPSIVRVRLIDAAETLQAAAEAQDGGAANTAAPGDRAERALQGPAGGLAAADTPATSYSPAAGRPTRVQVKPAAARDGAGAPSQAKRYAAAAPVDAAAPARALPEGAYGLGALPRDDQSQPAEQAQQSWQGMPSWAPFTERP
jgi:hypothetical protein